MSRRAFQFSADTPIRIVAGPDDSGLILASEAQPNELVVNGVVEIHLGFAQEKKIESLNLAFTGRVKIRIQRGKNTHTDEQDFFLPKHGTLWKIGEAFPAPGQHVLSIPFSFDIPVVRALPSIDYLSSFSDRTSGRVRYKLEATGVRNVSFGMDVKVTRHLDVIPPGFNMDPRVGMTPEDLIHTATSSEWKRSLMHSGSGKVEMRICLPGYKDRPFPMRTKIPFTVTLTTFSVPTYPTVDPSVDKEAQFPSFEPGSVKCALRLRLKRYACVRVRGALFGNVEQDVNNPEVVILSDMNKREKLNVDIGGKEWAGYEGPDEKLRGKGRWKQTFEFRSAFILLETFATPTFQSELLDVLYGVGLDCKIPSPSSVIPDHELKIKFPIVISSSQQPSVVMSDEDVGFIYNG